MKLTAENVSAVFKDCMTIEKDDTPVIIEGVKAKPTFSQEKLDKNKEAILAMLLQLHKPFMASSGAEGGGWSFLNMCEDKDSTLWTGFHEVMDQLVCLGLGIGKLEFCLPRDLWGIFHGGMPYVVVLDN